MGVEGKLCSDLPKPGKQIDQSINGHRVTARTGLRWSGPCKLTARRCLALGAVHAFHVPNHWFMFGFHFRRQSIGKAQHGIKQVVEGEDELEFW